MPVFQITAPDGKILRVTAPDGATQEDVLAHVQENYKPENNIRQETPKSTRGDAGGELRAIAYGLSGGQIPFGNVITSALGAGIAKAASPLSGDTRTYAELYEQAQEDTKATQEANRKSTLFGNALGFASTLPIGFSKGIGGATVPTTGSRGAINAIPEWLSKVNNIVGSSPIAGHGVLANIGNTTLRAGMRAGVAAPIAGLYGAGEAESGNRAQAFRESALTGASIAAAIPAVSAPLAYGIGKATQAVARMAIKKEIIQGGKGIADVSDKAAQKVIDRLKADFPNPEDFTTAMNQFVYGKKSLAELGGARTENLARGAAQFPSGEAVTRKFIEPKIAQAHENVTNAVKKFISNKYNYQDTVDDIVAKGQEKAKPLYDKVNAANPSMASTRLDAILNRPAARDALKTVAQDYQNKAALMAKPDPELTSLAKELSDLDMMAETKGGVSGGLKFSVLDAIKKELDLKTRAAKRAMDMGNDSGNTYRALNDVRSAFVDELDALDKSGLYAKARATAGDYITAEQAADMGTKFKNIDPQDLTRTMAGYTKAEKDAFRVGMVKQLREDISKSARDPAMSNANIYNKILGNKWQKDQIEAAIGKSNFQALEKELENTKRIYQLKQSVLGNSTTANKQIAAQEFDNQGQELLAQAMQNGWKSIAVDKVMNFVNRHFSGLSDKTAEDVAKILYTTDPTEKVKIYNRLKLSNIPTEEKKRALKAAFTIEGKTIPEKNAQLIVRVTPNKGD